MTDIILWKDDELFSNDSELSPAYREKIEKQGNM